MPHTLQYYSYVFLKSALLKLCYTFFIGFLCFFSLCITDEVLTLLIQSYCPHKSCCFTVQFCIAWWFLGTHMLHYSRTETFYSVENIVREKNAILAKWGHFTMPTFYTDLKISNINLDFLVSSWAGVLFLWSIGSCSIWWKVLPKSDLGLHKQSKTE